MRGRKRLHPTGDEDERVEPAEEDEEAVIEDAEAVKRISSGASGTSAGPMTVAASGGAKRTRAAWSNKQDQTLIEACIACSAAAIFREHHRYPWKLIAELFDNAIPESTTSTYFPALANACVCSGT